MSHFEEHRQRIVAKLTSARSELEDALSLATHAIPPNSEFVSESARIHWASMIVDLNNFIRQLEE
jgi:hypothetical protein